jgi:hypothetical protein
MTPHTSGTSLSAQARYAAGTREILECWFDDRPIPDEYLIVDGGKLAGTGAHSYRGCLAALRWIRAPLRASGLRRARAGQQVADADRVGAERVVAAGLGGSSVAEQVRRHDGVALGE